MTVPETDRLGSPKRRVMRIAALCFLVVASAFTAAEWIGTPSGLVPGTLVAAGLLLCVSASLLSLLLLIGRSGR